MSKLVEQTRAKALKMKENARAEYVRGVREEISIEIKAQRGEAKALSALLLEFEPKPDKSGRAGRASYVIEKA